MSSDGSPRSRSPKGDKAKGEAPIASPPVVATAAAANDDPDSWTEQIWDAICHNMNKKNDDFKDDVKKVVNTLVKKTN